MSKAEIAPTPSSQTPSGKMDVTHGCYRILAGPRGEVGEAIAYVGMRKLDHLTEDSADEALAAMIARLDKRRDAFIAQRDEQGLPSADEYREALDATPLIMESRLDTTLHAHSQRPGARANVGDLARSCGLTETAFWLEYGRLGRRLSALLGIDPPKDKTVRQLASLYTFATFEAGARPSDLTITLRPAFLEALQ
ncbi:hypothetical protein [Phenylobacterium sp.]|uniref:hypothetical protein n=1 Tax=Phenylobacterium sp. TaxID=1871053 RepID=UPI002731AC49|nr:hypothetical protein [Phenylobacterium sp.]MDP1875748.1 hypothetical protein [Phenylobacterium sp.]